MSFLASILVRSYERAVMRIIYHSTNTLGPFCSKFSDLELYLVIVDLLFAPFLLNALINGRNIIHSGDH